MYLLDTNIWLERLLNQARTAEVEQFLNQISAEQIFITDFTLHSIITPLAIIALDRDEYRKKRNYSLFHSTFLYKSPLANGNLYHD